MMAGAALGRCIHKGNREIGYRLSSGILLEELAIGITMRLGQIDQSPAWTFRQFGMGGEQSCQAGADPSGIGLPSWRRVASIMVGECAFSEIVPFGGCAAGQLARIEDHWWVHGIPCANNVIIGCANGEGGRLILAIRRSSDIIGPEMAIEAPPHRQSGILAHDSHRLDRSMAGLTGDPRLKVELMGKIDEIGQFMDAIPMHHAAIIDDPIGTGIGTGIDDCLEPLNLGTIGSHLAESPTMACQADRHRWDAGILAALRIEMAE